MVRGIRPYMQYENLFAWLPRENTLQKLTMDAAEKKLYCELTFYMRFAGCV